MIGSLVHYNSQTKASLIPYKYIILVHAVVAYLANLAVDASIL